MLRRRGLIVVVAAYVRHWSLRADLCMRFDAPACGAVIVVVVAIDALVAAVGDIIDVCAAGRVCTVNRSDNYV